MKIVSFNANGLRSRPHQIEGIIKEMNPEIIGIQETKASDEDFPKEYIESLGYNVSFHGQKGHYGIAIMSKPEPISVLKGLPSDDESAQKRFIMAEFPFGKDRIKILNIYFPQGENRNHQTKFPLKEKFFADLQHFLTENAKPDENILLMGDTNVAFEDKDIGIGEENRKRWLRAGKCSFLPEEREWMGNLRAWGLLDSYRLLFPEDSDKYSWFDYRSRGFEDSPKRGLRIDNILITPPLKAHLKGAGIDYQIRSMERPSDHCPIWAEFGV